MYPNCTKCVSLHPCNDSLSRKWYIQHGNKGIQLLSSDWHIRGDQSHAEIKRYRDRHRVLELLTKGGYVTFGCERMLTFKPLNGEKVLPLCGCIFQQNYSDLIYSECGRDSLRIQFLLQQTFSINVNVKAKLPPPLLVSK